MPAEVPESSRARAKIVPAAGESEEERRVWMSKRLALAAEEEVDKEAPAMIRIALLTKRANVKRLSVSSAIE